MADSLIGPGSDAYARVGGTWITSQVVSSSADGYTVQPHGGGAAVDVPVKDVLGCTQALSKEGVPDLIQLQDLHEASILVNLRQRYVNKEIYSYVGDILIAVNPYEMLPLYSASDRQAYRLDEPVIKNGNALSQMPPHVYYLADRCYRSAVVDKLSYSLIASGESGAGKTESIRQIMNFIAECTPEDKNLSIEKMAAAEEGREADTCVADKILQSSPILEAFGNAQTVNNDNSSRFGKFVQLRFDQSGVTAGAVITNYLLEKSRITHHAEGERTYHIMYQLYAACNDDMREDLFLTDHPSTFKILNPLPPGWGDSAESMKADAEGFEEVKAALWDMGDSQFSHALKTTIWQIVSAIMHLGNVSFEDETIGDGEAATHTESSKVAPSDAELLKQTCDLLGLSDPTQLAKALVTRTVTSGSGASRRGSQYTVPVTAVRAKDTADALGKQLYSKLFDLIVQCVNKSISGTDPSECLPNFVGLLDIYGFEVFEFNSFEQLCINFANEKLQQLFVAHVFKFEEAEYASEGIDFAAAVHYVDNSELISLIEATPIGILSLLDEECIFPNGTDASYITKLHSNIKNALISKPKFGAGKMETFVVTHFAGQVEYAGEGFLDKNKDKLSDDVVKLMQSSSIQTVADFFKEAEAAPADGADGEDAAAAASSSMAARNAKRKQNFVGSQFKTQLGQLMNILETTKTQFVRCVKANAQKSPGTFEDDLVVRQLNYLGVLDTVNIRQAGFAIRIPFKDFSDSYGVLLVASKEAAPAPALASPKSEDDAAAVLEAHKKACFELIAFLELKATDMQIGRTRLFIRNASVMAGIEVKKQALLFASAQSIQKVLKGHMASKRYGKQKAGTLVVSRHMKGCVQRWKYRGQRKAAIKLQSIARGRQATKRVAGVREDKRQRLASTAIQSHVRQRQATMDFARAKKAAVLIQSTVRMFIAQTEYKRRIKRIRELRANEKLSATLIQCNFRSSMERRDFMVAKHACIRLQSAFRVREAYKRVDNLRDEWEATVKATLDEVTVETLALHTVKKGVMLKKSTSAFGGWQSRYFVLHRDCMYYFKDAKSKGAQGYIELSDSHTPDLKKNEMTDKKHGKEYYIDPGSEDERIAWTDAVSSTMTHSKQKVDRIQRTESVTTERVRATSSYKQVGVDTRAGRSQTSWSKTSRGMSAAPEDSPVRAARMPSAPAPGAGAK